ncbi:hypothetical protein PHET_06640, partial [Paragonimus heterotremus]
YPDFAQIIPWSPEILSVHDRTVFECTCGNQAYLPNLKSKFAWKGGQKIFKITKNRFVLANVDIQAPLKETTPPTYECTVQTDNVTLVKRFTVRLIYDNIPELQIIPDLDSIARSDRHYTFQCVIHGESNSHQETVPKLIIKDVLFLPGLIQTDLFDNISSNLTHIRVKSIRFAQITLECTYGKNPILRAVQRVYKTKDYGVLRSTPDLVIFSSTLVSTISPCSFEPGEDAANLQIRIVIEHYSGPDDQFLIDGETLHIKGSPANQIVEFRCNVVVGENDVVDYVIARTIYVDKINLTIYPDKREHHVLMDRRWNIRCAPDLSDINEVAHKSVVWTLTCEHMAFCHYNLRSSSLATATTLLTIQPGVYTATCFMPKFPKVPKISITITVHPFVQLRITPTKMYLQPRQKETYHCFATEDYLEKKYNGFIEMSFVRGEQTAHIKQNSLIQAYTDMHSVGMYCCTLKSRIMEIKRYFVIAVYEIPELVLVNKFVFGSPNNLHQKMWVKPEFFGPLPSRIMCSYNPGQPRIFRVQDRVSFEHVYQNMTICSIIQCAYVIGHFPMSYRYERVCLINKDEQMEFEFYGLKRPGNKLSVQLQGNIRCQFRSVYLREMVSPNLISIVRVKGPTYVIRQNDMYITEGKPEEDFHYKCQFSADNYTIAEEVKYIFSVDEPYIRVVGGMTLFPRARLYCLDNRGGRSYPMNDPSDKRPPVARFRRGGNWIKLGRNMQKSSFYCQHRTQKDYRRYFELRIIDRLFPVLFPTTPLRVITGASYVLCLNADPTGEVYSKSVMNIDDANVKSAPISFMGRGIGSYFELTNKINEEGEHTWIQFHYVSKTI